MMSLERINRLALGMTYNHPDGGFRYRYRCFSGKYKVQFTRYKHVLCLLYLSTLYFVLCTLYLFLVDTSRIILQRALEQLRGAIEEIQK